ncbi:MAG: acyl-CoA dehydrogenase family protein [SAR86 cluster bacterium]|jgi:alkylation response protein AidB-like acyl-CoA dehydrogenase|nr:acyl-CoA dehydrogenase family protein [SAR86 cluster bacterium]
MDLKFSKKHQDFRKEARAWFKKNKPENKLLSFDTPEGFEIHRDWERKLSQGKWTAVTWPEKFGGRGADLIEWLIFEEEYYSSGAPGRVNQNGIFLLGPTLIDYGTSKQQDRFLPEMINGNEIWAQAWSEPNSGSDLASLVCKADRVGDKFILNGQKTWSSRAVYADWAFGLFRSEKGSHRHHGLSFILFPLNTPGVTVKPISQLDGEPGFAEIFFDNAEISTSNLLGEEGQGWEITMATAGFERGLMLRSPARFKATASALVGLYLKNKKEASSGVRGRVVDCVLDAEAYSLNTYWAASKLMNGGVIGAESSTNKIFWSELDCEMYDLASSLLGAEAALGIADKEANDAVEWIKGFLFSLAGPIYAGTNEIQRNIIAERILGLPK